MRAPAKRIRAGLYVVIDANGAAWTIEERPVAPAYGGGWAWFATCPATGDVLDPRPTLRDAKAAVIA